MTKQPQQTQAEQGRYLRLKPAVAQRCNYCYGTGKESDGFTCRTCGGRGYV